MKWTDSLKVFASMVEKKQEYVDNYEKIDPLHISLTQTAACSGVRKEHCQRG